MPTKQSYPDKVFQMLIDLKLGESFNTKSQVSTANREMFYEIVQCFQDSEFCPDDIEFFISETKIIKMKKGGWVLLKNSHIKEQILSPIFNKPSTKIKLNERNNTLRGEQGALF